MKSGPARITRVSGKLICCIGCSEKGTRDIFKKILSVTENENKCREVQDTLNYLMNNWEGITSGLMMQERYGVAVRKYRSAMFCQTV